MNERGAFTVPALAEWLGGGRSTIYEAMRRGALRAVKLGGRTLIPYPEAVRFRDSLPAAEFSPPPDKTAAA